MVFVADENERQRLVSQVLAARGALIASRWLPRSKPLRIAVVGLVLVGVVVLGTVVFVRASPDTQHPPPLPQGLASSSPSTTRSQAKLVVSVVGKVEKPGLVRLSDGARVADAIAAAGGARGKVDVRKLNLARRVGDGEQVFVGVPMPSWAQPRASEPPSSADGTAGGTASGGKEGGGKEGGGKIDLNTANGSQLGTLPGVGEITAKHILDWREKHGRFESAAQLKDVSGIGDAKFDKMKDSVTVR